MTQEERIDLMREVIDQHSKTLKQLVKKIESLEYQVKRVHAQNNCKPDLDVSMGSILMNWLKRKARNEFYKKMVDYDYA